jgi:hypothetical protein
MSLTKISWMPQVTVSVMLLIALIPGNPYGYYILLRWVVCGIFAFLAFQALEREKREWVWLFGITAAIYNPLIPIHIGKEIWSLVNVVTIGIAIASIFKLKRQLGTK